MKGIKQHTTPLTSRLSQVYQYAKASRRVAFIDIRFSSSIPVLGSDTKDYVWEIVDGLKLRGTPRYTGRLK